MKVDVSEIKTLRACKRQWQLTSRNKFHLTTVVPNPAFALGTIFHESLHKLYLGKPLADVLAYVENQSLDAKSTTMVERMVSGYATEVLPGDLEMYDVLMIEHHFEFTPQQYLALKGISTSNPNLIDTTVCGSIDMIVVKKDTGEIWGFEHKTAKSFRNDTYLWMDEQPRVYTAALELYVAALNSKRMTAWVEQGAEANREPVPYKLGGIFINEVRKLQRDFDQKRSTLVYPNDDLTNFMIGFFGSVAECHRIVSNNTPCFPQPSMFKCSMCDYKDVCEKFQYSSVTLDDILRVQSDLFKVREHDHLEEKEETDK